MGHGYPPWSGIKRDVIFSLPLDLGELAVRLGSPVTFDRRGDVIFLDEFENGLGHCQTLTSGAGGAVEMTTDETRYGGYAAKLIGGSDSSRWALLHYILPKPIFSGIGLETHFRVGDDVEYVSLRILVYDGTYYHEGEIRHDQANNRWEYLKADGTYVVFQTGAIIPSAAHLFHPAKLVVDLENDEYIRALVTGEEEDLSGIPLRVVLSAVNPDLRARVMVTSTAGNNGWVYADSVIITQNEPRKRE